MTILLLLLSNWLSGQEMVYNWGGSTHIYIYIHTYIYMHLVSVYVEVRIDTSI